LKCLEWIMDICLLWTDNGLIIVMSSFLFSVHGADIHFTNVAQQVSTFILNRYNSSGLTDEEWEVICSVDESSFQQVVLKLHSRTPPPNTETVWTKQSEKKRTMHIYSPGEWVVHLTVGKVECWWQSITYQCNGEMPKNSPKSVFECEDVVVLLILQIQLLF